MGLRNSTGKSARCLSVVELLLDADQLVVGILLVVDTAPIPPAVCGRRWWMS